MRYFRMKRAIQAASAAMLLSTTVVFADPAPTPGNPDTNASDRNYDTNQPNSVPGGLQKVEDGSNRALNKVDKGVHKATRKTKRGAHKAKAKTEKAADDMMAPAIEPATTPAQ